ncbi:tautomerase family protein [Marilutibacter alkalisoli]|uniref:Tautomerase n=1 Tax=Marilutibacter alkalisoli TaxID=2591633 RepID=A0A514BNI2_9GAMM|nr:4-oxalocrotonate tautomerase family protein [Lysobacter alkalisoli]QDH68920.1 4-oxalocrotonate tautomerase family protein [Lysobacter alkalisoli]
MPYVNMRITPGATRRQKAELIAGVTELLVRVLDKNPETTHVVIDEVDLENWGLGGLPVEEFRKRGNG